MIKFTIKDNQFYFDSIASRDNYFKTLGVYSNTNKLLVMTIEEYSKDITPGQYNLFKALLIKGSEISGYTYKELENELIDNFASYKYEKSILGEMVKIRKKVSEMNQKEFNIFIEQSIEFCTEFFGMKF